MVGEEVKEARLLGKSPVSLFSAGIFFFFGVMFWKSGFFSSIVYGLFLVFGIFGFGGLLLWFSAVRFLIGRAGKISR